MPPTFAALLELLLLVLVGLGEADVERVCITDDEVIVWLPVDEKGGLWRTAEVVAVNVDEGTGERVRV